jgi:hypothetical protein
VTDEPPPNASAPDEGEPLFLPDPYQLPPDHDGRSAPKPPADHGGSAPKPPAPRASLSPLALSSVLAALLLGPVGAILAILFGWYARHEIERAGGRRAGYALATMGVVLGMILTPAWGGLLSYLVWTGTYRRDPASGTDPEPPAADPPASLMTPPSPSTPAPQASPNLGLPRSLPMAAPAHTHVEHEGQITVVDLGRATSSLSDELARQRAQAAITGETMVVMTLHWGCAPCSGVDQALRDPLMQTALARVRLVRVDVETFREDLDALRIPSERLPGFFLLAIDLSPRDGIDGGEWNADVAPNMAPVLGAFVRGKYAERRERWRPVPGSGMAL